jgi:hypothetical protein
MLVAAPLVNGAYDTNTVNYKLFEVYTAGHEGTFFDTSMRFNLATPYAFGSHVKLALSKSKHATYVFNPEYYPVTPAYVIVGAYASISLLYYNGQINFYTYLASLFLLDQAFFECAVERFQNQGGIYAGTRINVGELHQPINGSGFILSDGITEKFEFLFY